MHATKSAFLVPLFAALLPACDAGTKKVDQGNPGPQLSFVQPRMDHVYKVAAKPEDSEKVEVFFDLKNYVVGDKKGASGKYEAGTGQHVHLILDNNAYVAIYDVSKPYVIDAKLVAPGSHLLRAFPSAGPADAKGARWHESRKNDGAFAWVRFHVGEKGTELDKFIPTDPLLTYSRPKGDYKLNGPDKALEFPLMLDFYLSNCALAADGLRVRATVDGTATEYSEWKPQSMKDLAVGEHTIVLELVDAKGLPVEGPYNKTERKIKVLEK